MFRMLAGEGRRPIPNRNVEPNTNYQMEMRSDLAKLYYRIAKNEMTTCLHHGCSRHTMRGCTFYMCTI